MFGMRDVLDVGYLRCGMFWMRDVWAEGYSACEIFRMCHVQDVECLGCGMFMSRMGDVQDVGGLGIMTLL